MKLLFFTFCFLLISFSTCVFGNPTEESTKNSNLVPNSYRSIPVNDTKMLETLGFFDNLLKSFGGEPYCDLLSRGREIHSAEAQTVFGTNYRIKLKVREQKMNKNGCAWVCLPVNTNNCTVTLYRNLSGKEISLTKFDCEKREISASKNVLLGEGEKGSTVGHRC